MKQCPKCKEVKSCNDFHKDSGKKDGLHHCCKKCAKQYYKNNREHQLNKNKEWRENNPVKLKLKNLKYNAKIRGHIWDIPKDIGYYLISSPCAYCGQIEEKFNGLDRVDSNGEYTIDNVVPCCRYCNYAKNNMSIEEFKNHITKIYKYMR